MLSLEVENEEARTELNPPGPRDGIVRRHRACRSLGWNGQGECHVAVNGREAVESFRSALERGEKYDLICMDVMMPEMDGREAVQQVPALEEAHGILLSYGAKIIMTTALDGIKGVFQCFKALCDAYLVKPIDLAKLLSQMKSYQLIP